MVRAIIIDDEAKAVKLVKSLLEHYCPTVEIVGTTTDSSEAVMLATELRPDVLFLDIKMPYLDGFEILEKLHDIPVLVVFVTAYNEFAIRAIKIRALDYLLKPIESDELILAVEKAEQLKQTRQQITESLASVIKDLGGRT